MSNTSSSTPTRGQRTRALLIAAAAARFQELGFERATTGEIARDAGVAEGTLFLHFGSKVGLLLGVMRAYYETLVEQLAEEASRGGTAEGRLRHLVRFWLMRVRGDWSLMRVFGQHGRFSDDPEIVAQFTEMNRKVTRFFGGLFEDLKAVGRIPEQMPTYILRDALFGTAEHLLIGMDTTGKERDLETAAETLCDLLLGFGTRRDALDPTLEDKVESMDVKLDRLLLEMSALKSSATADGPEGGAS